MAVTTSAGQRPEFDLVPTGSTLGLRSHDIIARLCGSQQGVVSACSRAFNARLFSELPSDLEPLQRHATFFDHRLNVQCPDESEGRAQRDPEFSSIYI